MEIVLNKCYGSFGVSEKLTTLYPYDARFTSRIDPLFVSVVKQLGKESNSLMSDLVIEQIPDTATDFIIVDYDGIEEVLYCEEGCIKQL